MLTVETLVGNLFVCGVPSLSNHGTPHTVGAKQLNLGFFVLMFGVYHNLKILEEKIVLCPQHYFPLPRKKPPYVHLVCGTVDV